VLALQTVEQSRLLATRISPASGSVAAAADLLEETARNRRHA
jgi:hypothetical protein